VSEGISLDDFEGDPPARDFRRANGAPMVRRRDDPTKWDRYSRPSGWGSDLDEKSALVNWRIDRAMEGVAMDPSIAATVAANLGRGDGRQERRERAIQRGRGDEAADIGTALHAMTHRVESNDGFVVPPTYAPDIAAYLAALDEAGLHSSYIEVHLCSDEWRAAGTCDRIYTATRELILPGGSRMARGQSVIGDLKTGTLKDYSIPGYTIQLAIYCDSVFYDVHSDERSPLPDGMRTDWGLIVSMPAGTGRCELLWCNLETGRAGARIVRDVRSWRHRKDFVVDFAMPADDEVAVMSMSPDEIVEAVFAEPPDEDVEWMDVMLPFAQQRIDTIGGLPEARATLMRTWPEGLPPPAAGPTTAQLAKILTLLDAVEAAYSIPFAVDPRRSVGHHKAIDISNNPATEHEP
jgi:hypothetical protein